MLGVRRRIRERKSLTLMESQVQYNKEKVIEFLNECGGDGWTIFAPSAYTDLGFSLDELKPIIKEHESNRADYKETIFDSKGGVMDKCEGIYNLDFLYWFARKLDIDTAVASFFGRGSNARALSAAILNKLNPKKAA